MDLGLARGHGQDRMEYGLHPTEYVQGTAGESPASIEALCNTAARRRRTVAQVLLLTIVTTILFDARYSHAQPRSEPDMDWGCIRYVLGSDEAAPPRPFLPISRERVQNPQNLYPSKRVAELHGPQ